MGLKRGSGIPCFSKVWFKPLHFYKRPVLVSVLLTTTTTKSKEDFSLLQRKKKKKKKKKKWKQLSVCFQQLLMEASSSPEQWESGQASSCPGHYTQHLSSKLPELSTTSVSTCAFSPFILSVCWQEVSQGIASLEHFGWWMTSEDHSTSRQRNLCYLSCRCCC